MKKEMDSSPKSEIILYHPNETVSLEVRLDEDTVWLTLNQMSILFGRDKSVISRHIAAIFKEEELEREAIVAKNATVQNENGRTVLRTIEYYNLDVPFPKNRTVSNFTMSKKMGSLHTL